MMPPAPTLWYAAARAPISATRAPILIMKNKSEQSGEPT